MRDAVACNSDEPNRPRGEAAHFAMPTLKGLELGKMMETVAAVKSDPVLAKFEFRAKNKWIEGGENRSTIMDFYGAGAEDTSRSKPFVFTNREPRCFLVATKEPTSRVLATRAGRLRDHDDGTACCGGAESASRACKRNSMATLISEACLASMTWCRQAINRSG